MQSQTLQSLTLADRELYDLECLLLGAYHPLTGFLRKKDYLSVLSNCRLISGQVWSLPVTLSCLPNQFQDGETILLRDPQGIILAEMKDCQVYSVDPVHEAMSVYGCTDDNHPQIAILLSSKERWYIGGEVTLITLPVHYDFLDYRLSTTAVKKFIAENNWKIIVGFQTRNPMHRSHYELTCRALSAASTKRETAKLLLTPAVGPTQSCDVDYTIRVSGYKSILSEYPEGTVKLVLLPLAMRMAGPREALHHAIIRRNYGCTHFIVGRDHAGPSYRRKDGSSFFGDYEAQIFVEKFAADLGITVITSPQICYSKDRQKYISIDQRLPDEQIMSISGTQQREMLNNGQELPEWFTFSSVSKILGKWYPPKHEQGFCVYFVGLSGSGKSTTANFLAQRLKDLTGRKITMLDGDLVRLNLSKGLTFSRKDRSTNVRRVGWVASEIVKHQGICICTTIAPYQDDRDYNRSEISQSGHYIEVWMNTPLETCEKRDHKGLYRKARTGELEHFTGISDPFEIPQCDIALDGSPERIIADNVHQIMLYLREQGLIQF